MMPKLEMLNPKNYLYGCVSSSVEGIYFDIVCLFFV